MHKKTNLIQLNERNATNFTQHNTEHTQIHTVAYSVIFLYIDSTYTFADQLWNNTGLLISPKEMALNYLTNYGK